jgi:1-acyl-sn-glycerol-3-phosphate acyltransferase
MPNNLPRDYRILRGLVRILTRAFFAEIACEGVSRIPAGTGGLIVSWHPNGLVDPALILAQFPGRVIFGARHGLFKWPLLGALMRGLGAVPIYRAGDLSDKNRRERLEANEASLDALARQLAGGSFSALFPEGLSHDNPHLSEIKTGAARLYYKAVELARADEPLPVIIPVGLHYDRKDIFRSRVLVCFHEPIQLSAELNIRQGEKVDAARRRELYRALTHKIEKTLVEVARATEDWDLHHLMHRLRKLVRAERASRAGAELPRPSIAEWELGFARVWHAYESRRKTHPDEIEALIDDVSEYDKFLRNVGLEDYELSRSPRVASPLWFGIVLLQFVAVFLLFPPILLVGYVINVLPYYALKGVSRVFSREAKDVATVKILGGSILFPCTWAVAAFLAARAHDEIHFIFPTLPDVPVTVAVATVVLGIVGGFLALIYNELSQESWRALRVRITRRRQRDVIKRLREKRADICDTVDQLMQGLELPGRITDDGRIVSDEEDDLWDSQSD